MFSCYFDYHKERHISCIACKCNTGNSEVGYLVCRNCWEFLLGHKYLVESIRLLEETSVDESSGKSEYKVLLPCRPGKCATCPIMAQVFPASMSACEAFNTVCPIYARQYDAICKFGNFLEWQRSHWQIEFPKPMIVKSRIKSVKKLKRRRIITEDDD